MTELAIIMMGAVLTNNFVLVKFLGICPFLGVSKKLDSAIGMELGSNPRHGSATAVTHPIYMGLWPASASSIYRPSCLF